MTNYIIVVRKDKVVNWVVPESSFDKILELSSSCPFHKKSSTSFYKYLYIVNKVSRDMINRYHNHKESRSLKVFNYKGCLINRRTLSSILGTKDGESSFMLNSLVNEGVLEKVEGFVKGVQSFRYRLVDTSDRMLYIKVSSDVSIIPAKIVKRYQELKSLKGYYKDLEFYKKSLESISINRYIYSILDTKHTQSHTSPYISPMGGDFDKKCVNNITSGISVEKMKAREVSVRTIEDGDWYCVRPTEGSRVHTNLTNFPRDFRPFLQIEGEDVIELDIRNSQPLIASLVIKGYYMERGGDIPDDVIEYKKSCEEGRFYDYFMEINNVSPDDRTDFKVKMFTEIFFGKVTNEETKLKKQFMDKYPNCYKAICDIKGGLYSKDYNRFAIMLQKKEAQIVYDGANLELLRKGVKAYNIFDSLLVKEKYMEEAKEVLLKHFLKENLNPQINFVNLGTERDKIIKSHMSKIDVKVNSYGLIFKDFGTGNILVSYNLDSDTVVEALFSKEEVDELGMDNMDYIDLYYKAYPEEYTEEIRVMEYLINEEVVKVGEFMTSAYLKSELQKVYDHLGINKKAKASDMTKIFGGVEESYRRVNGKSTRGFIIKK